MSNLSSIQRISILIFQNKLFWKYSNKGPFLVLSVQKCTVNDETKRSKKTTVDEIEPMLWYWIFESSEASIFQILNRVVWV